MGKAILAVDILIAAYLVGVAGKTVLDPAFQ